MLKNAICITFVIFVLKFKFIYSSYVVLGRGNILNAGTIRNPINTKHVGIKLNLKILLNTMFYRIFRDGKTAYGFQWTFIVSFWGLRLEIFIYIFIQILYFALFILTVLTVNVVFIVPETFCLLFMIAFTKMSPELPN